MGAHQTLGKIMFERSWPSDLPNCCPNCGKEFRSNVNLVIGPGRAASILKGLAYGMIVPWMIVAVVVFVLVGMPNGGLSGGYAILGFMFIPPALVALASVIFPFTRRIICTCGWRRDYPARPVKKKEAGAGQPASHLESNSEGGEKPQTESEGRSR